MGVASTGMAPLDTPAVRGVVEAEAVITLGDLWLWGIRNRRGRCFEEAKGSDFLGEGDDPADKGRIVPVRVLRDRYFNRGDAGLIFNLLGYLIFRDGNPVSIEVS
jgi:hypothetical protein